MFSNKGGARSAGIALALTIPGAAAPAVIVYAIGERVGGWFAAASPRDAPLVLAKPAACDSEEPAYD